MLFNRVEGLIQREAGRWGKWLQAAANDGWKKDSPATKKRSLCRNVDGGADKEACESPATGV
jgi:hypothetical protein